MPPTKPHHETSAEQLTRFRGKTLFSLLPCRVSLESAAPADTFVSMCSAFSISNASNFSITWDRLENREKGETRASLNTRTATVLSCTTPPTSGCRILRPSVHAHLAFSPCSSASSSVHKAGAKRPDLTCTVLPAAKVGEDLTLLSSTNIPKYREHPCRTSSNFLLANFTALGGAGIIEQL